MQRSPGQKTKTIGLHGRQYLELDVARQKVVDRLFADQAHKAVPGRRLLRLRDMPAGKIATARVDDLPLRCGHVDGLPDLVPWRRPVDVVELVQVDVVRPETGQAGIECPANVQRREPALVGPAPVAS